VIGAWSAVLALLCSFFTFNLSCLVTDKSELLLRSCVLHRAAAVVGGVFTVAGILDSVLYTGMNMAKKIELGKQG
jgi:hypothetical protein